MDRRTFLVGSASVFTAIVSGCTTFADEERDGVILTHVELGNASDGPQVFDVLATHDDEIIHWSSHEVEVTENEEAAGGEVIGINAPDEYGRVEVLVRAKDQWAQTDFDTDEYDGERVIAVVTYGMVEDELLRISRRVSDRPSDA